MPQNGGATGRGFQDVPLPGNKQDDDAGRSLGQFYAEMEKRPYNVLEKWFD